MSSPVNARSNLSSSLESSRFFVTGGTGLVGSAVQRLFGSESQSLSRNDCDLRDFGSVKELFLEKRPRRVLHLAASVGGLGDQLRHPGKFFHENILINTNVLEAARLAGTKKLLSFLSSCVFPDKVEFPLHEDTLHAGPPHPSNFGYAYAKRMLEVQSSAYRKEWGCHFILAIPTNIYGPCDQFSLETGHVLPALIHRCYRAKNSNETFKVWGSGKPLREFVYVDDIAQLAIWTLENYDEDSPIFFSSAIETSIAEVVEIIATAMKFKGRIEFDASKPDGQFRKPSDNSKLKKLYPEFKFTSVREGIEKTVDWFLSHYPDIRK